MYNLNTNRNNGAAPPLYKGNLGVRQTELTIFVFANGDEFNCNQAKRFNLCKFDLLAWNPTLDAIAIRMGLRKKGIKSLYTPGGKRINGYWELSNGGCYVGVGPHERFRKLHYSDPATKLLDSKIKARKQIEKENESKGGTRFNSFTKRTATHSPSKPSKSVEELRRIYTKSNTRRRRHVLTSSIPYYMKANPDDGNIRKTCAVRSSSLNLPTESTQEKIRKFTSKYLPYYTKLQKDFFDQTHGKQANNTKNCQRKLPSVDKSVVLKTSKTAHMNTPATNISSQCSVPLVSNTSPTAHVNTPASDIFSQCSVPLVSNTSQTAHVNTPATNISSHCSVPLVSNTSQTAHVNTPATNVSAHCSVPLLSNTSQTVHVNTPATNVSSQYSVPLVSNTSQTAHVNTPATNISSQYSVPLVSNTSQTTHMNTPATNISPRTSCTLLSNSLQVIHTHTLATNISLHSSSDIIRTNTLTMNVSSHSSSDLIHTNIPATNVSLHSSSDLTHTNTPSTKAPLHSCNTFLLNYSRVLHTKTRTNISSQSSVRLPPPKLSQADRANTLIHKPLHNSVKKPRSATAYLACIPILKPESPNGVDEVKSSSYFSDLEIEAETLAKWEAETYVECGEARISDIETETDTYLDCGEAHTLAIDKTSADCGQATIQEVGELRECRSPVTLKDWCDDRPSTTKTEYPEETEDTLIDYWFMSEAEFEDESSDDLEEEGLKMRFLQLD